MTFKLLANLALGAKTNHSPGILGKKTGGGNLDAAKFSSAVICQKSKHHAGGAHTNRPSLGNFQHNAFLAKGVGGHGQNGHAAPVHRPAVGGHVGGTPHIQVQPSVRGGHFGGIAHQQGVQHGGAHQGHGGHQAGGGHKSGGGLFDLFGLKSKLIQGVFGHKGLLGGILGKKGIIGGIIQKTGLGKILGIPLGIFSSLVGHDGAKKAAADGDIMGWLVNTQDHTSHTHAAGGSDHGGGSGAPLGFLGTIGQKLGGLVGLDKMFGSAIEYDQTYGTNYSNHENGGNPNY